MPGRCWALRIGPCRSGWRNRPWPKGGLCGPWRSRYGEAAHRPHPSSRAASATARRADGAGLRPATRLRPPGLLELEQLLADLLDTRVGVQMGAKRGKVTIEFADLEDLERIYRRMAGEG